MSKSGAWCAATNVVNEWFQIDLQRKMIITRVATQARGGGSQYVTKYELQISVDGVGFECYSVTNGTCKVFNGNWGNTVRSNYLKPSAVGRYVRFSVQAWGGHISGKFEVYGYDA
ncbi:lactadherin-like, partial [Lingula anatina]|uniref:Lactadherin-like n=1 Tax=Lingula anatina TaxID=7574 RepID=A0A1S3ILW2_LINAN